MDKKSQFTSPQVVEKIQQFEKNTGYELVVVAAEASDPYPGALWRSAIINALLVAALLFQFYTFTPRLIEVAIIAGLLGVFYLFFKLTGLHRFFILPSEAERETREKAESLFSRFQSSSLGHEASVLLFFSLSEHKMHLLIDRVLNEKLKEDDLLEILTLLRLHFKQGDFQHGLEKAIGQLEQKVLSKVGKNIHPPTLVIEDRIFWI